MLVASDVLLFTFVQHLLRYLRQGLFGDSATLAAVAVAPKGSIAGPQLLLAVLAALALFGTYGGDDRWRDAPRILVAVAVGVVVAFYADAWSGDATAVLLRGVLAWMVLGFLLAAGRVALGVLVRRVNLSVEERRVGVVRGRGDETEVDLGRGYRMVAESRLDEPVVPDLDAWGRDRVDTLLLLGELPSEVRVRLLDEAIARGFRLLATPRDSTLAGAEPRRIVVGGRPLLELAAPQLQAPQMLLKRTLDIVLALLLIVVLAPVLALTALWVRVDSPGPALFGQERVGQGGTSFRLLKFRTMRRDAEAVLAGDPELRLRYVENDYKLPAADDPRITRAGRVLRRTSLDELPQLFNVLKGEMSLVGPRPVVPDEVIHYAAARSLFLSLKPGMTGMWAVSGRSEVGYPDRALLEIDYVRGWSIFRDLWILAATLPAVLLRRGAY